MDNKKFEDINGTIMIGGVVIIAAGVSALTNNSDK